MSYVGKNPQVEGIQFEPVTDLIALNAISSPQEGWTRYVSSEDSLYTYNGSAWIQVTSGAPAPTITLQPVHYGYASGSAGASVVILDEDQSGTFQISNSGTGIFTITWTDLTLTEDVCFVPFIINNGSTTDEFGCYVAAYSNTSATVITTVNQAKANADFVWMMSPQGVDAPTQTGQIMYSCVVNANDTLKSENVASTFTVGTRPAFPTPGYQTYRIDNSLSLTDIPMVFSNFSDATQTSDGQKIIGAEQTTTRSQIQINDYGGGDPFHEHDIHFIMFLGDADDPETVVANSKWFAAGNDRASTVTRENIPAGITGVTYSTETSTFDITAAGISEFIALGFGFNPFNGGDGGSRHFYNQSFSTGSSTGTISEGDASLNTNSNGFTRMNMVFLPTGADNRF